MSVRMFPGTIESNLTQFNPLLNLQFEEDEGPSLNDISCGSPGFLLGYPQRISCGPTQSPAMRLCLATDPGTMETAISNLWNCEPKYMCPTFKLLLSNNLKITWHQALTPSIWQIIYGSKHIVLGSPPFSSIIFYVQCSLRLPLLIVFALCEIYNSILMWSQRTRLYRLEKWLTGWEDMMFSQIAGIQLPAPIKLSTPAPEDWYSLLASKVTPPHVITHTYSHTYT